MEKVKTTKTKIKRQKTKKGQVSIRNKKNGKEARVTLQLNIEGVSNPRLSKYGDTEEIARKRLAEAILLTYIEIQKRNKIANMQVFSPECQAELEKFDEYMECIRQNQLQANGQKGDSNKKKKSLSTYVYKMIKIKKQQAETKNNKSKKRLSPHTFSYYVRTAKKQVLPIFGDRDVTTLTTEELQEHIDSLEYKTKYLKDIKLVIKLALDIAVEESVIPYNVAERVKIVRDKKSLGIEIEHLEQDRQEVWLNLFEKDKRQWAYLFEAILLTGARPEEACRFKMECDGF